MESYNNKAATLTQQLFSAGKAAAQFAKLASCVALATQHEAAVGQRYALLLRTRPDVLWQSPVLSGGVSLASLARVRWQPVLRRQR